MNEVIVLGPEKNASKRIVLISAFVFAYRDEKEYLSGILL
jgi:hypothetical protein